MNKKNCYKFVVCNFIFTLEPCSMDVQYSNRTSIDKQYVKTGLSKLFKRITIVIDLKLTK